MVQEAATVSQDGYLCVWDLQQHMCTRRLYLGTFITSSVKAFCMEFHPTGHELTIGLSSGELLIVDCGTFKVSFRKNIKSNSGSTTNLQVGLSGPGFRAIAQVKYCPNAKYLAVGVKDTFVYIYDVVNGYKKLHVCEGHSSAVMHLTWNKDGDILQSNAADGEILHWLVSPNKGETKQNNDAFLVRDVQWIKWTCVFGWSTPGIWSEESPNVVDIAAVSTTGPKTSSEFNEPGTTRTTSSEDLIAVACRSSVHLLKYPAHRGARRKVYKAHSSAIVALDFSFDDSYLVTVGGDDGAIMQWKVLPGGEASPRGRAKGVQNNTKGIPKLQMSEDDSTGESWPNSSPVPPPHDEKQPASQLSPRRISRQYRERQTYREAGLGEMDSDRESLHQNVAHDTNSPGKREGSSGGAPVDRYRGPVDPGDSLPAPVQVRITHDYAAENSDELSLNYGEILRVLSKAGGEWWLGETCDGTKGYFPASYVEEVDLSVPIASSEANEEQVAEG
ncbi:hypothetical protein ON010_g13510 [Phytophthora cinnamomi]|nr:hypothetical protein ON010_g13510 [Phytophthora cinnamomi]